MDTTNELMQVKEREQAIQRELDDIRARRAELMRRLSASGWSLRKIGALYGMSGEAVRHSMAKR